MFPKANLNNVAKYGKIVYANTVNEYQPITILVFRVVPFSYPSLIFFHKSVFSKTAFLKKFSSSNKDETINGV